MTGMPTKMMMGRNRIRVNGGLGGGGSLGGGGCGLMQDAVSLSSCCAAELRGAYVWWQFARPVPMGSSAWGTPPLPSPQTGCSTAAQAP